ncbi:hypothetical protein BGW39_008289 [Mortierella sp. 14UC]|nr:hypothetical protein BGW39_008289 [Mortierella sp. 14UC]
MDFTFSVPSGIPPFTFGSSTSTTPPATTAATSTNTASTTTSNAALESSLSSMEEHISLKRIHGVGDTKQWRRRLIHQIEDRIKDRRESIHNAKRREFSFGGGVGSGVGSGVGGGSENVSAGSSSRAGSGEGAFLGGGAMGGAVPMTVGPAGQGQGTFVFGQGLGGPASAGHGDLIANSGGDAAQPYISEEEERRIVAEVWEAFKNENYAALAQAFQGMTDKEIENIEQDILQHNYVTDSDSMYETIMDMEESNMEEYAEHYMNQPDNDQKTAVNDEMTAALSIAWTLLSRTPCIRCHQGAVLFEPVLQGSLAEGARAICSGTPSGTGVGADVGAGVGRGGCGLRLERDALLYLANAANTHSQTCRGELQIGYDEEMGLLLACPHCDFLA